MTDEPGGTLGTHADPGRAPEAGQQPRPEQGWRRLTPRMLLVFPVRELGRFLPLLLGIFLLGRSGDRGHWWAIGAGALIIVIGFVRWFTTRFRITDENIEVRSGLVRRRSIAASVDRVRTVDLTSKLIHRLLGLATVEIGTAGAGAQERLALDSLPMKEARRLRAELLHRRTLVGTGATGITPGTGAAATRPGSVIAGNTAPGGASQDGATEGAVPRHGGSDPDRERVLLRFDPTWARYAPLTLSGVLTGAIIVGFAWRLANETGTDIDNITAIEQSTRTLARMPVGTAVLVVAVILLLAVTVLSVAGYFLSFWNLRLSRSDRGSLHMERGLLTTRAISIDQRRLRGVELVEPLLLRWARAAKLSAITTGLRGGGRNGNGENRATLVPPAPRTVACRVACDVLGEHAALSVTLVRHGPAAAARRYTRALVGSVIIIAVAILAWIPGLPAFPRLPGAVAVASLALIPVGVLVARDRYRNLGHALHGRHLVRRAGSFVRRTSIVHRDGVIGWNLRQSFFQRRAGLTTLTATTAAGAQHYRIMDVDDPVAVRFAAAATPGLLEQFFVA